MEVLLLARMMMVIVIGMACCGERFHLRNGNNARGNCVVSAGEKRGDK